MQAVNSDLKSGLEWVSIAVRFGILLGPSPSPLSLRSSIPSKCSPTYSDLHLEVERGDQPLYTLVFPACAPNLALLGDIGWTRNERLFIWLELQLTRFERVFFVSGNHEPYVGTLTESEAVIEAFATKAVAMREKDRTVGEFVYMNRRRYDLSPNVSILGCTLWTALDPEALDILSWSLTDFKRITNFTPEKYQQVHEKDLCWLEESIKDIRTNDTSRKIVVFTHHASTVEGTSDPKWVGGLTNSAFAIELTQASWWGPPVTLWAFGHMHWSCDFERNGTRVVSNQRGYGHGSGDSDVKKVISI